MSEPDFKPFCAHEPHFDGRCILSLNPDGESWTVETDFSFHMGNGDGFHLTVNKGDQTDGASIPNLGLIGATIMLAAIVPHGLGHHQAGIVMQVIGWLVALAGVRFKPWGRHGIGSVCHDHLYRYSTLPRIICDAYFWISMRTPNQGVRVDHVTAAIIFLFVRLFGWASYYKKRKTYLEAAQVRAYASRHSHTPPEPL